ncbi:GLPGLI family protein [Flavobacterium sp. 83]|jgi:GLPGLI family protein|uniref:GLPGLI family protein n=1 Tax=Flavobacterium sp. 83 TaxID=1131812 RepID=UPI00068DFE0C|nr:GLPGLI family protein [Flavobacterium sp. 83]
MRKTFLFLALLNTIIMFSQLKGIANYGYIEALDIGYAKGLDSNAYIIFNREQSYYVTAKDSLEKPEKINEKRTFQSEDGGQTSSYNGMKVSPLGDQVVYHIQKNTMWSNFLYRKQIYIKEIAPKINWTIEKETKKIGNFTCKRATAIFRGRNYTAWYSPEIAVPFGPWKLNGLPGLILEAYDVNKFVYWYFKNIEYPTKNKESVKYISIPKGITFKSNEEFKIFQKEQINIIKDKQKLAKKIYPDVQFGAPQLSNMFVEFE